MNPDTRGGKSPEGKYGTVEEYADGEIQEHHGIVNKWLLVVYLILFVWALYYLWLYWGGPGAGLVY